MLIARTLSAASEGQAAEVRRLLGDPGLGADGIGRLREIIEETGALAASEEMIKRYLDDALGSLERAPITGEARGALEDLAVAATSRRS
jgi:geranylgeranyl diphosphate synthase type I